jgi:hypothetical protein
MKINNVYAYPDVDLLKEIISSKHLRAASPFYSSSSLRLINPRKVKSLTLITRLPTQYIMPSAFIENDPAPLADLARRMGGRMKLFALPGLHAKLYVNEESAWVGSSNFTKNGFSGKQEIVIHFDSEDSIWPDIYKNYQNNAVEVGLNELKKLSEWVTLGLTNIRSFVRSEGKSEVESKKISMTLEDFIDWLADPSQPMTKTRKHLYERVQGKNYMSGHVPPSFNGALSFLQLNPKYIFDLVGVSDQSIPQQVLDDFAAFILKFGDQYRGSRGGYWRNYLSVKLGGAQVSGGAGDTVAKKCLVLIPAYIRARG